MEEHRQRPVTSDEMDLAQFFRWIGRGFSNFGNSLISLLAALRNLFHQNRIFFFGIMVMGLVLGALYSELLKKDIYKSSMVLSCDYLNPQSLASVIQKLNLLASERDTQGLQELLGIDAATAANIQRFTFKPFVTEKDVVQMEVLREQLNNVTNDKRELVDRIIDRLEIENRNAYEISVYVYNPDIVKPLEKAIVEYLRDNTYIASRIVSNRKRLEEKKNKLQTDLRVLDSLKRNLVLNYRSLAQASRGSNNVVVGGEDGMTNPVEIFEADLKIHKELQEVETKLELGTDFEVVDGFTSFKEPESASLPDILVVSLLLSILIGYLILGAYRFDRMLAEYPKKRSASRT